MDQVCSYYRGRRGTITLRGGMPGWSATAEAPPAGTGAPEDIMEGRGRSWKLPPKLPRLAVHLLEWKLLSTSMGASTAFVVASTTPAKRAGVL